MPGIDKGSKTIVITRPKADARKLATTLEKKGFQCIVEPILSVRTLYENEKPIEYALDKKPQVIIVTSRHAVAALATMTGERNIPVVAVGRATADMAVNLGFRNVGFANGSANSLLAYVESYYSPKDGPLLYVRGRNISTDIAARLSHNNFMVDSVTLYQAKTARKLSAKLCEAILENSVEGIIFFSQNTLKAYAKLAIASDIAAAHNTITALCMSPKIAEKAASLLKWKKVEIFDTYLQKCDA